MSASTFVLLFALYDAHGNMVQTRVTNFTSMAACQLVGEALKPSITWNCEPGPPLPCTPPAIS
jgi:hypothetical protein